MAKDFDIEKLKGNSNYHTWQFAIKNVLEYKGLIKCIADPVTETKEDKLTNCKAILALSVESHIYVHIQKCLSASEIWKTLKNLYEDRGLSRKISLLRSLISTKLCDCENMQSYIDNILSLSNKLTGVGFDISDDWLVAILLTGLSDKYQPFIMSIEASNTKISADTVITKLLDSQSSDMNGEAFLGAKNKSKKKKNKINKRKCYICGSDKHLSNTCTQKNAKDDKSDSGTAKNAFSAMLANDKQDIWYLDSGASSHMTPRGDYITSKKQSQIAEIVAANNSRMKVKNSGELKVRIQDNEIDVSDVLHVPELSANLLSVYKIASKGNTVVFNVDGCTVYNSNNKKLLHCQAENGVYKLNMNSEQCMISKGENSAITWHRRFGHVNYQSLIKMKNGIVNGMDFNADKLDLMVCETCAMGKQTRAPFNASSSETTQLLELIHSDLCGPMETQSIGKAKYMLTFIDDFSKKIFVYFLRQKSDVINKFIEFKVMVERQTERKIKIMRTDNGGEYLNEEFNVFFKANGIIHQLTCPYTAQQNGTAERYNRTIIERARCMLHDANLPKTYWAEAVNMAAYLINRTVCSTLINKTPEEVWSGKKVDVSHIRIFGSPVMVHVPKEKRKKLDFKSQKLIFVGFDEYTKGYRCIDTSNYKLCISRDVIFLETQLPERIAIMDDTKDEDANDNVVDTDSVRDESVNVDSSPSSQDTVVNVADDTVADVSDDSEYVPEETISPTNVTPITTRSRSAGIAPFQLNYFALLTEPSTVNEAINGPDCNNWKIAMCEEIESHKKNGTWELAMLPNGRKAIKAKWVFKLKRDENGNIIRYKARLVAKGCAQKSGLDYNETFSPVVRYTSIRFLLALACKNDYKIHQMDAITAFLQGDLDEDIFMQQPENFEDGTERVCKLKRAIYGLKQAGRQWNIKLDNALQKFGLQKSKSDPCIYYSGNLMLIIAIYVDDFLIFYKEQDELSRIKAYLNKTFHMKDLGKVKSCIGIRIKQGDGFIEIDQSQYIRDIIKRFRMEDCKPVGNPADTSLKLSKDMVTDDNSLKGKVPYQEAVGSLLFLSQGSRPDIAFAVNDVSRFNQNHSETHWKAVKRIIRYLSGTIDWKIRYEKNGNIDLHAFTDADWGSEQDERRSCTGFVVMMANGAISWNSKRQSIVALSSTEAEYIALSSTVREVIWIRQLANELNRDLIGPTKILCDNQSAIKLAKCDAYRPRTKHIDIRYHHIREKIEDKSIMVDFISTKIMTADALTKAVTKEKHLLCAEQMGLFND